MIVGGARVNPFPGLRSFESDDEDHPFFGREEQVDDLLARLRRSRFLAVVGTSGSGKSSLVKAGLIPRLHGGFMAGAGSHWRIADFRPELEPIANMARRLARPDALGEPGLRVESQAPMMEATIRGGARGLIEAVQEAGVGPDENVLVVVDQFEELFRFATSATNDPERNQAVVNEAAAFVKKLLEAASDPETSIYVALTMRSDFIGDCARFHDLPERINDGLFLVPRMTRDQLRRAIEGPIQVAGARVEPAVVTRLLNDVGDDPDKLPVLQHVLMRTWDYWAANHASDEPISVRDYEDVGQLQSALAHHANLVFGTLSAEQQDVAARLFKGLTLSDRGTDLQGTRRPTRFGDAHRIVGVEPGVLLEVVKKFNDRSCSFLMPPPDVEIVDATVLDISHESLMRFWPRLQGWVREEAEAARVYRRLVFDAERRAPVWRGADLAQGLEWLKKNGRYLNEAWAARYGS